MRKRWYQWEFSLGHLLAFVAITYFASKHVLVSESSITDKVGVACFLLLCLVLVAWSAWRKLRREMYGVFRLRGNGDALGPDEQFQQDEEGS